MVSKSFSLTIEGKTYQVAVLQPGVISIDGKVIPVEANGKRVNVNGTSVVASLSEDFAVVGGKLYDITWQVK